MLIQLCKQVWFVCLMVFAIGWSSVSIASVNAMQIKMQMQHQQTQNQSNTHQRQSSMLGMSLQEMNNHCIDLQQAVTQDAHHNPAQHMQALKDCHTQLIQTQHAQQADCQDCALFFCQSSIVWFNADLPKLVEPPVNLEKNSLKIHYQAQHLVGHWQEILRPPKA